MSDVGHDLHRETRAAKVLRENLHDILADDDAMARDVVEGETNLNEAIAAAVDQLAADNAAIAGIDEYIKKFTVRKERLKRRVENTRTALLAAMEQAGRKSFEHPAVTLSVRPVAASAVIIDEALVPSEYWKASDPKLDKRAVLKALKAKEDVPGAQLSNGGQTIQMKWS